MMKETIELMFLEHQKKKYTEPAIVDSFDLWKVEYSLTCLRASVFAMRENNFPKGE